MCTTCGLGIFGLVLRFAVTPMDRWAAVRGVDSIFDNSPLYQRFVNGYLNLDAIRSKRTVDESTCRSAR